MDMCYLEITDVSVRVSEERSTVSQKSNVRMQHFSSHLHKFRLFYNLHTLHLFNKCLISVQHLRPSRYLKHNWKSNIWAITFPSVSYRDRRPVFLLNSKLNTVHNLLYFHNHMSKSGFEPFYPPEKSEMWIILDHKLLFVFCNSTLLKQALVFYVQYNDVISVVYFIVMLTLGV